MIPEPQKGCFVAEAVDWWVSAITPHVIEAFWPRTRHISRFRGMQILGRADWYLLMTPTFSRVVVCGSSRSALITTSVIVLV